MNTPIESPIPSTRATRPLGSPMMPVRGAMSVLNVVEEEIEKLIECGELLWVFDVSSKPKTAHSRELRILPDAVADYAQGKKCSLEWENVWRLLVPHDY